MGVVTLYGNNRRHVPFSEQYPHTPQDSVTSQVPIAASVTPWSALTGRQERSAYLDSEDWQNKVRLYDREGPGIVGATLDIPAAMSMLVDLCVRRRTPTGYQTVKDDPVLVALLHMWRGETLDQKHLFARLLRSLDAVGECYLVINNAGAPGRITWDVVQTPQVTDNRDGTVTVRKRPDARPGDKDHRIIDDKWVFHTMVPDPVWPAVAWSPLRRGVPHIENYRLATRNLGRGLESQLVMNGVFWAKAVAQKTQWMDNMKAWGHQAIARDDGPEAVLPFMMATAEKPEYIEVGRGDHTDQIEVARHFLKDFADSQDLPTNMILEGPAQGNHWNAFLESDYNADMVMSPRSQRACSAITNTHFRRLLANLPASVGSYNVDDFDVWGEDTRLRTRTDNSDKIMKLGELGIANSAALAESAGLNPDQILVRPDGVSEYEHWLATKNPGLATRAGGLAGLVDERGSLVEGPALTDPGMPDMSDAVDRVFAAEVSEATDEIVGELGARRNQSFWDALV